MVSVQHWSQSLSHETLTPGHSRLAHHQLQHQYHVGVDIERIQHCL